MKKLITFLLVLLLACGTFIACDKDSPQGVLNETTSQETTECETTEQNINANEANDQGFTFKGQKYVYQNNDILILDVENTTDTHYTAALAVTFYDEAGEVIKTQKKTFKQFPAGFKQACMFQPHCQFDSYTVELSLEEYTDTAYLSTFSCEKYASEIRRVANMPIGNGKYEAVMYVKFKGNFGPCSEIPDGKALRIKCDVVVLDNTGEIYTIVENSLIFGNTDKTTTESNDIPLLRSTEDPEMQIPDELRGEITVIPILKGFELLNNPMH